MNATISFEQDAQLVNQLLALLSREQTSLVMADIDAIESLLEEKSVLLQRMNITAKTRYEALATNGFEAGETGMIAWLKQQAKPNMNDSWTEFQKALSQAKEMNRLNGMLISKHFNRNQQLLNHLQGNSSAGAVYGKNGQAQSSSTLRTGLTA
ncbi:MAG: flagella synthesis protein FlgN [Methylophilaceae bacterium]|jgi:flagella synthesis protein FlgN